MHAPTPRQMSTTLARSLAGLDDASPKDVAEAIASWPFGWRVVLAADDIIDSTVPEADGHDDVAFTLTEAGEELVRECAIWARSAGDHETDHAHGGRTHPATTKALVHLVRRGWSMVPVQMWVRAGWGMASVQRRKRPMQRR